MDISIVDNINGEMKRYGMSQETLCKHLGVERKTFYEWKKKGDIPASKLIKCACLFNCSLDYLARDVQLNKGKPKETKSA